tara:strand:- start:7037 stop:7789 length:753 start_codon:yes stop_codon:yes gene_type:complete
MIYIFLFIFIIYFYYNYNYESFKNFNPRIAVVIPCVPKHIKHLPKLLNTINQQTRKPNKVIIALSSSNSKNCQEVKTLKKHLDDKIIFIVDCCKEKKNAASNRNRCLKHCLDVKYISFMDADDEMCKDKLKLVTDIMEKYNADMGLHSFSNGSSKNKCSKGKKIYSPEEMKKIEKSDQKNLHISKVTVHHGHCTISLDLFKNHKQNENMNFGEDSKYVRDTFKKNYKVVYTNSVLSNYYYTRSTHNYGTE